MLLPASSEASFRRCYLRRSGRRLRYGSSFLARMHTPADGHASSALSINLTALGNYGRLCADSNVANGSSAAETWLVSVTGCNVGRVQHCGTSIIGLPVSFLDLSFGSTGPGWSRVGATGHNPIFDGRK